MNLVVVSSSSILLYFIFYIFILIVLEINAKCFDKEYLKKIKRYKWMTMVQYEIKKSQIWKKNKITNNLCDVYIYIQVKRRNERKQTWTLEKNENLPTLGKLPTP
jgi:hypothetical protein